MWPTTNGLKDSTNVTSTALQAKNSVEKNIQKPSTLPLDKSVTFLLSKGKLIKAAKSGIISCFKRPANMSNFDFKYFLPNGTKILNSTFSSWLKNTSPSTHWKVRCFAYTIYKKKSLLHSHFSINYFFYKPFNMLGVLILSSLPC